MKLIDIVRMDAVERFNTASVVKRQTIQEHTGALCNLAMYFLDFVVDEFVNDSDKLLFLQVCIIHDRHESILSDVNGPVKEFFIDKEKWNKAKAIVDPLYVDLKSQLYSNNRVLYDLFEALDRCIEPSFYLARFGNRNDPVSNDILNLCYVNSIIFLSESAVKCVMKTDIVELYSSSLNAFLNDGSTSLDHKCGSKLTTPTSIFDVIGRMNNV